MRTSYKVLKELLQYELHGAERHRRFLSLVMVVSDKGLQGLKNFLGAHIRTSDVWADDENSLAVLMGETDPGDALEAIERYKGFFDSQIDLRFSVVTYPADGGKPANLLDKAKSRLQRAVEGGEGAVVCND